jgi:hypothetical protein
MDGRAFLKNYQKSLTKVNNESESESIDLNENKKNIMIRMVRKTHDNSENDKCPQSESDLSSDNSDNDNS